MTRSTFLCAHAAGPDWHHALDSCCRQLQAQLTEAVENHGQSAFPTLGWCYLSDYYGDAAEAILGELQRRLPGVAWVGTTAVGVAAGGLEFIDEAALVLMLAPLPREQFRLFSGRQPWPAADSGFIPHTALVHAEGATPDLQELVQELAARTASGYLFGGLSSARSRTLQIADGVFSGGLSGVLFGPGVGLISRVTQGCQPIGPQRRVTAAEDNFVIGLDGRPALDCVLEDLGLPPGASLEAMSQPLSAVLVGLRQGRDDLPPWPGQFGADTVVRHLIGIDLRHRVLAIADSVAVDMHLSFCTRNREAARADLVRVATEIREELGGADDGSPGRAAGALYVSCSGRGGPHFGEPHAELQTLQAALGELPLVGFFAAGEIARDRLYGYTGVLTVFTTPD